MSSLPKSPFEIALILRTVVAGGFLGFATWVVSIATDEPNASWPGRLGRISALLPMVGAVGAALVFGQARSRGEVRALQAMGVSPMTIARGPWLGAVLIGLFGVAAMASGWADIDSLFPRIERGLAWTFVDGVWKERASGLLVLPSGVIEMQSAEASSLESPRQDLEGATMLATFATSLALPAWALRESRPLRRLVVLLLSGLAAVTSFHLVAAAKIPAQGLLAMPLILLLDALLRGRSAVRET